MPISSNMNNIEVVIKMLNMTDCGVESTAVVIKNNVSAVPAKTEETISFTIITLYLYMRAMTKLIKRVRIII